jgi:hypothetical protein
MSPDQERQKKQALQHALHHHRHGPQLVAYERKIESKEDKMNRKFAEHNGDYDNYHLGMKRKNSESEDLMPRIDSLENPDNLDKAYRT